MAKFKTDPLKFLVGRETARAVSCVVSYLCDYTGSWFNQLADDDHNQISPADLVAVTMLGVEVPAPVAIWLLRPDGQQEVSSLLSGIESELITEAPQGELEDGSQADQLWELLQSRRWPQGQVSSNGLGPVTAGKLLAAKRPGLIPIWDHVVDKALGPPSHRFWITMWDRFQDENFVSELGQIHTKALVTCRSRGVAIPTEPSLLRTLDIVIWMREFGCHRSPEREVRELFGKGLGSA